MLGRSLSTLRVSHSSRTTKRELIDAIERARHEHSQLSVALDPVLDPRILLEPVRAFSGDAEDLRCIDANNAAKDHRRARHGDAIALMSRRELHGHAGATPFVMFVDVLKTGEPLSLQSFAYRRSEASVDSYFHLRVDSISEALSCAWREVTAQHELSQRYQLLSENSSDVVYQTAPDGAFEWVSPSIERVLGWSPEELMRSSEFALIPTEQQATLGALRSRVLEGQDGE